jgi:tetratricopeptide (TPR) repeat protein
MEAIFGRLVQAYETLMRPEARRVYDATLAPRTAPAELPLDPRVAAKRQAAREALKQHFAGGRERARPHVEAAKRARANDDFVGAAQAYNKALTFLPNDASLRASLADVERLAGDRLRETLARQAAIQEDFGRWAEAAESWKRVIALRPNDPEAEQRLARALARMRRES